ncbi:hypothetical protein L1887_02082 [Cichorium endivia]|nr:hypothetical protein L1887_02082 [Cichorium endivia]
MSMCVDEGHKGLIETSKKHVVAAPKMVTPNRIPFQPLKMKYDASSEGQRQGKSCAYYLHFPQALDFKGRGFKQFYWNWLKGELVLINHAKKITYGLNWEPSSMWHLNLNQCLNMAIKRFLKWIVKKDCKLFSYRTAQGDAKRVMTKLVCHIFEVGLLLTNHAQEKGLMLVNHVKRITIRWSWESRIVWSPYHDLFLMVEAMKILCKVIEQAKLGSGIERRIVMIILSGCNNQAKDVKITFGRMLGLAIMDGITSQPVNLSFVCTRIVQYVLHEPSILLASTLIGYSL